MKNPWMSAWLSAANKAAGPVRGAMMAEAKRQQTRMLRAMLGGAPKRPAAKARKGR